MNINKLLLLTGGIFFFAACAKRETTHIDVTVVNKGNHNLFAEAIVKQKIDDNRCKPHYSQTTGLKNVGPGESSRLMTSIDCYGKVHAYFTVSYDTNYSVGSLGISKPHIAAKLIPGVQFNITNFDRTQVFKIEIINAIPNNTNYTFPWTFAPGNAVQVAWLVPNKSSWNLYFSLPEGMDKKELFIEFDESLGIDEFGSHFIEHSNGVYRSFVVIWRGPKVLAGTNHGAMVCDDIGCNYQE